MMVPMNRDGDSSGHLPWVVILVHLCGAWVFGWYKRPSRVCHSLYWVVGGLRDCS